MSDDCKGGGLPGLDYMAALACNNPTDPCTCTECCLRRELERSTAEVERLMKELDATQETLARYRRAGIEAEGEIQTLRRELEETQIVAKGHRDSNKILFRDNKEFLRLRDSAVSIAERAEHRANQCEAERDQARADLASAQKVVEVAKEWQEQYRRDCAGNHEPFAAKIVDAILRGEGPK